MDALRLFEDLNPPNDADSTQTVYSIRAARADGRILAAVDEGGYRAFLIDLASEAQNAPGLTYEMDNIEIRHNLRVAIIDHAGSKTERRMSIVRCPQRDIEMQNLFVHCVGTSLLAGVELDSVDDLNRVLRHLVDLFKRTSLPPVNSIIGLWGELLMIKISSVPQAAIAAWHAEPSSIYDFRHEGFAVEVKTAMGRSRKHHITYEQANPPGHMQVRLASIITERTDNGTSVLDLWSLCANEIATDASSVQKINDLCMRALGTDWRAARRLRFDETTAVCGLGLFDMRGIPRIVERPDGVSQLQWQTCLDNCAQLSVEPNDWTAFLG